MIPIDLPTIWAFIIAFAVFVYVVMDGFDLGLGILFPLFPQKADRDVIMNSVAPVWDGNETWLVLGGGGMMAAFPLAYAVLMPALYTPMIAMLLGLVFRGVAFEFRWRTSQTGRNRWDIAFAGGSLLATLAQGIALGAILQGVHVDGRHYAGGWWDWLTPFSVLTGVALVIGYALLGATWLVMKTEGTLRDRAYHLSWILLMAMLAAIGAVSIATPFLSVQYTQRWFAWPNLVLTAPVPIAVAGVTVLLLRSLANKYDYQPFFLTLPLHRAAEHHDLAGGVAREQPDLHAGRRRRAGAADIGLYRLGLLGVPRQGEARKRLPLTPADPGTEPNPSPLTQRLLWFAALWLGGVGTVALISFGLRLWIAPK
jgi:cytochrome d ubiquinol oxidase subunit II